ncbi:hypothetical protein OnM2_036014 [Erysiphe neolycopersici]|uniref:Uncharacterized protein n=1 Tax=Erysiphe neolycopersici TaxID=212602 RepID=A0A420HXE5_9PEZI|nr:hypothetical protein OnM2_036014 [Erysiphe neolycopersici]
MNGARTETNIDRCRKKSQEKKTKIKIQSLTVPAGNSYLKVLAGDDRNLRLMRSPENVSVGMAIDFIGGFWGRENAFLQVTPAVTTTTTTTTTIINAKKFSKRKIKKELDRNDESAESYCIPPSPPALVPFWSPSLPVVMGSVQVPMTTYYSEAYLLPGPPVLSRQSVLVQPGRNLIPSEPALLYPLEGHGHSREMFLILPTLADYQNLVLP